MLSLLSECADYVFIVLLITGIILIIYDDAAGVLSSFGLRQSLKNRNMNIKRISFTERHIGIMLEMFPSIKIGAKGFMLISAGAAVLMWILCFNKTGIIISLSASAVTGILPYILLRMRFESIKNKVSEEAGNLVSIILSSYRVNGGNIEGALERAASEKTELPASSKLTAVFLMKLRDSSTRAAADKAAAEYADSLGGSWAKLLALNVSGAFIRGTDISVTLEDIEKQLREAQILMEERMRSNSESVRMTVFMIPASILMSVFLSLTQMDMTLVQLVKAQFSDSTAIIMFAASAGLFVFNLAAVQFLKNRRTDIY